MSLLDRPTPWDHATNEERAKECARFLAVHMLIGLSDCRRICDRVREMAEGEREAREIAGKLTKAQREAIYPGPGNPEYARGPVASMKALERLDVVMHVNSFSTNGKRGGRLTPLGLAVRSILKGEA